MTNDSQQIVAKDWNFAHVLRDDGLSYMANTEQIAFLLFLKMADEMTRPPEPVGPMNATARRRVRNGLVIKSSHLPAKPAPALVGARQRRNARRNHHDDRDH